jgi:hypothetical protein
MSRVVACAGLSERRNRAWYEERVPPHATRPRGVTPVRSYSLTHLDDHVLLRDLAALVARDRATTAALLAHLAEVDTRRLYAPAGYPSMHGYCVGELRLSEDSAYKRIRAARAARDFPAIFAAVADGRLHLSAVVMLSSYLTAENADELLAAAAHKSKSELEQLLAERFPRPDAATCVQTVSPGAAPDFRQLAPGPVGAHEQLAARPVEAPSPHPRLSPLSPGRYALQLTIGQATHDKLRHAQALLGHALPSGDIAQVLDRALDALIARLEQRKFAATTRPRAGRSSTDPRHVAAEVRRAVWARDGGRCTFVSECGRPARRARGSSSTTWTRWRAGARRRWRTSGCAAGCTTTSRRSACSGLRSCSTSARRLGVPPRRPGVPRRALAVRQRKLGSARLRKPERVPRKKRGRARSPRPKRGHARASGPRR